MNVAQQGMVSASIDALKQLNSVKMRQRVENANALHQNLMETRNTLKKIVKIANHLASSSREFHMSTEEFHTELSSLPLQSSKPDGFNLEIFAATLQEYEKNRFHVVSHMAKAFEVPLTYLNDDLMKEIQEKQKKLHLTVKEYDQLHRKTHIKGKESLQEQLCEKERLFHKECTEYQKIVKTALDRANLDIKDKFCSYMFLFVNFCISSGDSTDQLQPLLHQLTGQLLMDRTKKKKPRRLEAGPSRFSILLDESIRKGLEKEGYINIRQEKSDRNIISNWKLRWVVIRNGHILVYKRWKSTKPRFSFDMRFVTVKSEFCFDSSLHLLKIIPTEANPIVLKAASFDDFLSWKEIIEAALKHCFQVSRRTQSSIDTDSDIKGEFQKHVLVRFCEADSKNKFCADCSAPDPDWASINLGILICHDCSGIHRSLGVHISKIRSVLLDRWTEAQMSIILATGNTKSNGIFENNIPEEVTKPSANAGRLQKQQFILSKYVEKKFIPPLDMSNSDLDNALVEAIELKDMFEASKMLIYGANINVIFNGETLLHYCCNLGDASLVEFLLQHDSQPNLLDKDECTPLDLAVLKDHNECIEQLISRGAEQSSLSQKRRSCSLELKISLSE